MRVSNPVSVKYLWKTYFAYYCLQIVVLIIAGYSEVQNSSE